MTDGKGLKAEMMNHGVDIPRVIEVRALAAINALLTMSETRLGRLSSPFRTIYHSFPSGATSII